MHCLQGFAQPRTSHFASKLGCAEPVPSESGTLNAIKKFPGLFIPLICHRPFYSFFCVVNLCNHQCNLICEYVIVSDPTNKCACDCARVRERTAVDIVWLKVLIVSSPKF